MMPNLDREIFSKLKDRMKGKFPKLLEGYLRDAKIYLATIETNITNGKLTEIIEAAHSLKSASALLGIMEVHEEAKKIEYAAKDMVDQNIDDTQTLAPACSLLFSAFSAVEGILRSELQRTG